MRLVIDLQGAQGTSRLRGIGRYCLSLTQGLVRNRGDHEVLVALNGSFPESVDAIRAALIDLIPSENIRIWYPPVPVHSSAAGHDPRRRAAELVRESFLASLSPDFILVSSIFEGLDDNIVTSIAQLSSNIPTAAVLFDLIPLIHGDVYLKNPVIEKWYQNKINHLRNADLLLAISDSSREEAVKYLGMDGDRVVNIATAAEEYFTPSPVGPDALARLAKKYRLVRPFIMYTGGIDYRKNIDGLIAAFAKLPKAVRSGYQLAIVCSVQDDDRRLLSKLAKDLGLLDDDVVLTGYIPEEDLLTAYRACALFVFPSWHEGFGLPVLEAMRCGRPVIASNRSSLPEVVGLESALFDPFDHDQMSRKIAEVLTDDQLRSDLQAHSLRQAEKFSWDETSRRAWQAIENCNARIIQKMPTAVPVPMRRPRLALFSPLPPDASGIADYVGELLPVLSRHYRIELIVAQDNVKDLGIRANYPIRDIGWFRQNAHNFDRILYHIGNSTFHSHMFDLLSAHPGVVVLHDFFLSGIVAHRDVTGENPGGWARALSHAHGWPAVVHRYNAEDTADVVWAYPCNLQIIEDALGVIVHSEYSRQLASTWYGVGAGQDWSLVPHLRHASFRQDREKSRKILGIDEKDFLVCSFGILGRTKLNHRLLKAWLNSCLAEQPECRLIFVGQNDDGDYGRDLARLISACAATDRIVITGWTDADTFSHWLAAADVGVQLRTHSRGETSGTVLDCMNAGLATIINAHGSMRELPIDCVWLLEDQFSDLELIDALATIWRDKELRHSLGDAAHRHIEQYHQPHRCAQGYADAIEGFYERAVVREHGLGRALVELDGELGGQEWAAIADCVARNTPPEPQRKRLFIDISELVLEDSRSGIQRVVRAILMHWLQTPPAGWLVEPVYSTVGQAGFRHARRFTSRFLDIPADWCSDEYVEPRRGDIFLGLDLSPVMIPQQEELLLEWRRAGVDIRFVIYDLLPVILPEFFMDDARPIYHRWLGAVAKFDGVICISRASADEFKYWLDNYGPKRELPLPIDWFHLGGDGENSNPTKGLPESAKGVLDRLRTDPSFLSVGTLEPRKGHRQLLNAFELLWQQGQAVNLILVGKLGWMMDDFAERVSRHPQAGKRLFWLEAISDEYLDEVYDACRCLIAPSEGEGFGLPIIEAARHGLPVLARDIAVFREVGGAEARYFRNDKRPEVIAEAVADMVSRMGAADTLRPVGWQSWAESANTLFHRLSGQQPSYQLWTRDEVQRFWGSDMRLETFVGEAEGQSVRTSGRAGFLSAGPSLPLEAGSYNVRAEGKVETLSGTEYVTFVSEDSHCHFRGEPIQDGAQWAVDATIHLDDSVESYEIKVWVSADSKMSLSSIRLERIVPVDV